MQLRRIIGRGATWLSLALCCGLWGCVQPFGGAFIQVDFNENVLPPAAIGQAPAPNQPPEGTHYTFYWIDNATDADGNLTAYWFKAGDFDIRPLINLADPCQVDIEPTNWPGIHIAHVYYRLVEDLGYDRPANAPEDASEFDLARLVLAAKRRMVQPLLAGIPAVTSHSGKLPLVPDTVCADDPASDPDLPPPVVDGGGNPICFDDTSNLRRQEVCSRFFEANPDYFVGSDRVFSFAVNGEFRGAVASKDPRGPQIVNDIEGAGLFVDSDMQEVDALVVTYQYNDADDDGEPDYPAGFTDEQKSSVGYPYLSGTPNPYPNRGVINIELYHAVDPTISGEASLYNNLDTDTVHF